MSALQLNPLNDFIVKVTLKDVDGTTGVVTPLTTGTVTAFLAVTNAPTATEADATLTMNPTHIGKGVWLVAFDAALLDPTLLASLFASGVYLIVQKPSGVRVWFETSYSADREGTVA